MTIPTDGLYPQQTHLDRIGDIEAVWDDYTGRGVRVAVYDFGIDLSHPDLAANYDTSGHFSFAGITQDGRPDDPASAHGTAVAGIIAAAANGSGTVGVAHGANVTAVELGPLFDNWDIFRAGIRHAANFDVMNNSWGLTAPFWDDDLNLNVPGSTAQVLDSLFAEASATGRGGLGTVIVQAAGNDAFDSNADGMLASRHALLVGAIWPDADYTNIGPAIFVAAPEATITTDNSGSSGYNVSGNAQGDYLNTDYTNQFGGTSSATAVVSGVVALMLQANPNLGARDIKNILALSADRGDGNASVVTLLAKDQSRVWNGGAMSYGDNGFGMINAHAAVRMAEAWSLFDREALTSENEISQVISFDKSDFSIPDRNAGTGSPGSVQTKSVETPILMTVETIMVTISLQHSYASDLFIELINSNGRRVTIFDRFGGETLLDDGLTWTFKVEGFRGMDNAGRWTIEITDNYPRDVGIVNWVEIEVFGADDSQDLNDVYTFTKDGGKFSQIDPSRYNRPLDTDGGIDWVNFSSMTTDIIRNLEEEVIFLGIENFASGDGNDYIQGNSISNEIHGMRGRDSLFGFEGDDTLFGGAGDDKLSGSIGHDRLFGGLGNDQLNGSAGDDWIEGEDGDDRLYGDGGQDTLVGGEGSDQLTDRYSGNEFFGGEGNDTVNSGEGQDTIYGGTGSDLLYAAGGHDLVYSNDGDDQVDGAYGNDTIYVAEGDDYVAGGVGDDTVDGGAGNDALNGNAGNDTVEAGTGNDSVWGEDGNDRILGGDGIDRLYGGTGNDSADGGVGVDFLYGEAGLDSLSGGLGNDALFGGEDNDRILAGDNDDTADGGLGDDVIDGGTGNDRLLGREGADTINGQDGNDILAGGEGNDVLLAWTGDDSVLGEAGADLIRTVDGNDTADGGTGADTVDGGLGDDSLFGGLDNDRMLAGDGNDTVDGGAGDDVIDGGTGNDRMLGRDGADTLFALDGNDTVAGGEGNDAVWAAAGDDFVLGEGGADILRGGDGLDRIDGGADNDTVDGGIGNDVIAGGDGNDSLAGADGDDNLVGGIGADTVEGGAGRDVLAGDAGADMLAGGDGSDRIDGGAGNDTMAGGGGRDVFVFAPGGGADVIVDFTDDADALRLDAQLWGGGLKLRDVLQTFGAVDDLGQVVLDFGADVLVITGITSVESLYNDTNIA